MNTLKTIEKKEYAVEGDLSLIVPMAENRKNEEYIGHLAAIVEFSDDAIISKSLDGTIKSWNKGSEKMFGYTAKEAVGKNISLIIPAEHISEEKSILERICNNEIIDHYETVRIRKNGEKFYVSLTLSPLKNSTGGITGVSKIAHDITSRKKSAELIVANKELSFQNEEKDKRAAELIIANKELSFQNEEKEKRAAELIVANKELSFQNEEKEKRAAELVVANKELSFQNEEKEKRAAELVVANKELFFQNEEKEKRAAELVVANKELFFQNEEKEKRAAELVVANKELFFQNEEKEKRAAELVVANKELSFQNEEKEKRAAELVVANKELSFQNEEKAKRAAELVVANKELAFQNAEREKQTAELILRTDDLESFSYSVSHDLRAPLRAVNGYAQMLEANYGKQLDTEAIRLMNNIMVNAKRMGQLIDDLLTFSRIGRKEVVKMYIPMQSMVKNISEELRNEQGDRNIEFDIRELLPAQADNMALKQVWLNLISNAIKYSRFKEKTIIEIGSEIKGEEIIYYIKDNGAGFDMRYADKLFNIFQRLHSDEEFEGTGIGLAIVQRIISKHGGRIWAESKVDEGAVFYFTLQKS